MSTDRCKHGVEMSAICDQCDDERSDQRECSFAAPTGSARSWKIGWTQRNGMQRTGHAASDLALISMLTDIMERSEPRKIALKPNTELSSERAAEQQQQTGADARRLLE